MKSVKFINASIASMSMRWTVLACILMAHFGGWSQKVVVTRDAGLWLGAKVEKRVVPGWMVSLSSLSRDHDGF